MFDGALQAMYKRQTAPIADRGTVMNIISWMLLAVAVCTLVARFAMKLSMKTRRRKLGLDDLFIGLAALFSFGQTVAVSVESMKVLGQHVHNITTDQIVVFQKAQYAAMMFYIANMGCARIAVCLLLGKVLPGAVPKYTVLIFAGFTAVWAVSGVLVTVFACSLPDPWKFIGNKMCYNVHSFVNYVGVTNIVVEILLVIIPLIVWNVRTSRRTSVSFVFLARLSVVAAVSAQLYFFNNAPMSDFSYNCWPAVLCQQIAQNLAVISACLPCLHPFIIKVLEGSIEPETISFTSCTPSFMRKYLGRTTQIFDPPSSQESQISTANLTEKMEPYCRPLATYGLDRSSNLHRQSHSTTHFPPNTAKPVFNAQPPQNVFNRLVEVPQSRPGTTTSTTDPLAIPRNLNDVGCLPSIDWDTNSSSSGGSRRNSPTRYPTAEYVFNRQQVISVPEEKHLYDDGLKKFAPPVPSPEWPNRPRRAF